MRRRRRKGREKMKKTVGQRTGLLAVLPLLVPLLGPGTTALIPNILTFSESIRETPKVCRGEGRRVCVGVSMCVTENHHMLHRHKQLLLSM